MKIPPQPSEINDPAMAQISKGVAYGVQPGYADWQKGIQPRAVTFTDGVYADAGPCIRPPASIGKTYP